jgi:GxxExxY protein
MTDLHKDPRTYAIIGAAMEVHRHLGCGFVEPVYQDALEIELGLRGIEFQREGEVRIIFKEIELKTKYKPDFICFGEVVVELKALDSLSSNEEMQVLNYLKATGFRVGLLVNFGRASLEYKRFVWNDRWDVPKDQ